MWNQHFSGKTHKRGIFTLETPKIEWVRKASVCGNYNLIEGKEKDY